MRRTEILIIIAIAFVFNSCKIKDDTANPIEGTINRIVITDKAEYQTIFFVVTLKNIGNKKALLFTNIYFANNEYKDEGIKLKVDNFETPLAAMFTSENLILIKPQETQKFIFIYSNTYPNKWKHINSNNIKAELTEIANNASLTYRKADLKSSFGPSEKDVHIVDDFMLNRAENLKTEYRSKVTVEEAMQWIGGKVIEN